MGRSNKNKIKLCDSKMDLRDAQFTVFISYAIQDSELFRVERLATLLEQYPEIERVQYWERDAICRIDEYMEKEVQNCDIFLLFCSQKSLHSENVQKEWETALRLNKTIIPIFTEKEYMPPQVSLFRGVPFQSASDQYYDYNLSDAIYRLILGRVKKWTDREIIKYLESVLGRPIPRRGNLHKKSNLGVEYKGPKVVGLGLNSALLECDLTELPPLVCALESLELLDLTGNGLTSLPPNIGRLRNLWLLELKRNQLVTLPESFCDLTSLDFLWAEENQFTHIPPVLCQLEHLSVLSMRYNQLTSLPECLVNMPKLSSLFVDGNQIEIVPPTVLQWVRDKNIRVIPEDLFSQKT